VKSSAERRPESRAQSITEKGIVKEQSRKQHREEASEQSRRQHR
jgi:hypothetical protein